VISLFGLKLPTNPESVAETHMLSGFNMVDRRNYLRHDKGMETKQLRYYKLYMLIADIYKAYRGPY
jgi:hypothetical protein